MSANQNKVYTLKLYCKCMQQKMYQLKAQNGKSTKAKCRIKSKTRYVEISHVSGIEMINKQTNNKFVKIKFESYE